MKEFVKLLNIKVIKEVSGNIIQVVEIVMFCFEIDIYFGNDDQIVFVFLVGGIGVILVLVNILFDEMYDIVEYFLNGEIEKVRQFQLKFFFIIKVFFIEVNLIFVKEVMNMMGFNVGKLRLLFIIMIEKNREIFKKVFVDYGILIKEWE